MGYGFAPFKLKPEGYSCAIAFRMSKVYLLNAERFDCGKLLEKEYNHKEYAAFGNIMVFLFCQSGEEKKKFLIVNYHLCPDPVKGFAR